ncbi:MAG: hypothetical protein FK730_05720 [Asgard group archaeon]|nr:hypothetical protein [Asgard group archaeon]
MKTKSIITSLLLILLVGSSSSLFGLISNNSILSSKNVKADDNSNFILAYDFDSSPINELYLVFNERKLDQSKLKLITADSDYQWNYTAETIIEENNSLLLDSNPSLIASSEKLWLVNSFTSANKNGMLFFKRDYNEKIWQKSILFLMNSINILDPNLKLDESNQTIWLCWKDTHESTYNYYYMMYNMTTEIWSNNYTLNTVNSLNCSNCDFIIDGSGNAHFTWSQGGDFNKQIFYRSVMSNGTQSSIETITDGSTNCINPAIVLDLYNYLNIFWENQTVYFPQNYGTINIETSRKQINGTWSQSIEVAPYIPPERPPTGESDAYQPAAAIDKENNLWLAHKINEDYAYRQGADIRNRNGLIWKPSRALSLVNSLITKPQLNCDNAGNLHCLWLDFRTGYIQIYYRVKFINNYWSDEILLTRTGFISNGIWKIILITLGIIVLFSIPIYLMNRYLRKRSERNLKKKLDLLQE